MQNVFRWNRTPTIDILPTLKGEDSRPALGYCGLRRDSSGSGLPAIFMTYGVIDHR
jgi:hypothetical protein